MKIGDEVYIHGYVDEIRKDTVIIRNNGGYFGTVREEIKKKEPTKKAEPNKCKDCKWLCGKKRPIGIECLHPDRPFYVTASDVAHYKRPSAKACKRFEKKEEVENEE